MYSRSPNRDELEVGKKLKRTAAASGIRWLEDGWAEVAEPQGRAQSSSSTPPRFPMPPHYAAGKWGMRDHADVKDGRLLPPVCTEAQGSRQ